MNGPRMDLRKASGDRSVSSGVKYQSNVRSGNLDIHIGFAGYAISPINNPIISREDCSFLHGWGYVTAQMSQKIAGATMRVALGQHLGTMLAQNLLANNLRCATDHFVGHSFIGRRCERNDGSDVIRPLTML